MSVISRQHYIGAKLYTRVSVYNIYVAYVLYIRVCFPIELSQPSAYKPIQIAKNIFSSSAILIDEWCLADTDRAVSYMMKYGTDSSVWHE